MNDNLTTRMLLTTAVFAAVAALLTGPAAAFVMDVEGGGAAVTAASAVEPGTIPYLSHGIGVDESLFSGAVANEAERVAAQTKGPIPYLSQGVGVDQSVYQGEQSLGLTGDSALTRVSAPEPEGLTGDAALTRGDVFAASNTGVASDTEFNWTWVGFGGGMALLLAAAMGALYLSARHRGRIALP